MKRHHNQSELGGHSGEVVGFLDYDDLELGTPSLTIDVQGFGAAYLLSDDFGTTTCDGLFVSPSLPACSLVICFRVAKMSPSYQGVAYINSPCRCAQFGKGAASLKRGCDHGCCSQASDNAMLAGLGLSRADQPGWGRSPALLQYDPEKAAQQQRVLHLAQPQ